VGRGEAERRRAAAEAANLTSAGVPPVGPDDHVRGSGREAILYTDLACPACAIAWAQVRELSLRLCLRHFPLASRRPRAPALHAAAEAVGRQRPEAFWEMVDAIYGDHGHQDDPHLWDRVRALGLDLARFERDRRSPEVERRVRRDLESGIRAGVSATPTAFVAGEPSTGDIGARLTRLSAL
jgi:protein-disulfide isomerase